MLRLLGAARNVNASGPMGAGEDTRTSASTGTGASRRHTDSIGTQSNVRFARKRFSLALSVGIDIYRYVSRGERIQRPCISN